MQFMKSRNKSYDNCSKSIYCWTDLLRTRRLQSKRRRRLGRWMNCMEMHRMNITRKKATYNFHGIPLRFITGWAHIAFRSHIEDEWLGVALFSAHAKGYNCNNGPRADSVQSIWLSICRIPTTNAIKLRMCASTRSDLCIFISSRVPTIVTRKAAENYSIHTHKKRPNTR